MDSFVRFQNLSSRMYLKAGAGRTVTQSNNNNDASTLWSIIVAGDSVMIRSATSRLYLSASRERLRGGDRRTLVFQTSSSSVGPNSGALDWISIPLGDFILLKTLYDRIGFLCGLSGSPGIYLATVYSPRVPLEIPWVLWAVQPVPAAAAAGYIGYILRPPTPPPPPAESDSESRSRTKTPEAISWNFCCGVELLTRAVDPKCGTNLPRFTRPVKALMEAVMKSYDEEKSVRAVAESSQNVLSEEFRKAVLESKFLGDEIQMLQSAIRRPEEYIVTLQQFSRDLQAEVKEKGEIISKLQNAIVEILNMARENQSSLKRQLEACKISQQEALKLKEELKLEVCSHRSELQQVREDRDQQLAHVQSSTAQIADYRELTGKSAKELDDFLTRTTLLEDPIPVPDAASVSYTPVTSLQIPSADAAAGNPSVS